MNQNEKVLAALKEAKTTTFRSQGRKVNQDDDMVRVQFDMPINEFRSFVRVLESQPVAGQVIGEGMESERLSQELGAGCHVPGISGPIAATAPILDVDIVRLIKAGDLGGAEQAVYAYRNQWLVKLTALRTAQQPQAPAVEVPILDCRCMCEACEARTKETYNLAIECYNCGWEGVALIRKGDGFPSTKDCPNCGNMRLHALLTKGVHS